MRTQEFFGQVQNKARLATLDEAMRATRATLQVLADRIGAQEAQNLGAQLPSEIKHYLITARSVDGERFTSDEFLQRVSHVEGADLPDAVHHVRAVLEVLQDAVDAGEISDVLARMPDDYQRLFAGSQGKMPPS